MKAEPPIRVLVADDHPIYRQGLAETISRRVDLELVGEAESGSDALELIQKLNPDVAVIDMKMPGLGGMEVARAILEADLPTQVLFLSGYLESATVYEAVQAGARGYISKDHDAEMICEAIAAVAGGQMVLAPEVQEAIAKEIRLRTEGARSSLSKRECEILAMTAEGRSAADIADRLYLSPATVKTHLQRTYQKLGVSDRAAAVAEALRRGLLD
jgi:two-component system, NarL family, nitrate/nitrite response regulator NarL